jgi:hypothetical protein
LHHFFETYCEPPDAEDRADVSDFTWPLKWKSSALPNVVWPEEFLKPGNERSQRSLFLVTLGGGGSRISFPGGIMFPISPDDPASYELLARFSADAPFRMNAKHFQVGIIGQNGAPRWRKPDADTAARLKAVI